MKRYILLILVLGILLTYGCVGGNNTNVKNNNPTQNVNTNNGNGSSAVASQSFSWKDIDGIRVDAIPDKKDDAYGNYIVVMFKEGKTEVPENMLPKTMNLNAHVIIYASEYNGTGPKAARIPTRKVYEGDVKITKNCISSLDTRDPECHPFIPNSEVGKRQGDESLAGILNVTVTLPDGRKLSDLGYSVSIPSE